MPKKQIAFALMSVFALAVLSLEINAQTVVESFEVWPDTTRFQIQNGSDGNDLQVEIAGDTLVEGAAAFRCAWRVQANSFAGIWTRLLVWNPASAPILDCSSFTHLDLWYYNSVPSSAPSRVAFQLSLIEAGDTNADATEIDQYELWTSQHDILGEGVGWQQLHVPLQTVDIGSRKTAVWRQSSTGIDGNGKLDVDKIRGFVFNFAGSVSLLSNEKTASGLILFDGFALSGQANGNPAKAVEIVILGSSSAEGAGPGDWNNAWVNRYRTYLKNQNIYHKVHNLARGGYTTYHVLPTGYATPPGRPSVDTERNVTRALDLNPDAIIIALPTNDAAYGYTAQEQLGNYETVNSLAASVEVPVWITTPQGRNMTEAKRQVMIDVRDSTYAHYGTYALDFFTDVALEDATVNPVYDAGDGIHLNDAGHEILFNRMRDAEIPAQLSTGIKEFEKKPDDLELLGNYPNPFNPVTKIQFSVHSDQWVRLKVYDMLGREVATLINEQRSAGTHTVNFDAAGLTSGIYLYRLISAGQAFSRKMLLLR
ncbi:MAG: T9SS C-terminal target domain-containing protein [Calditrichaeota bacterium]|nr:MAG: T9SS C-terminal target domain-containing protein [Calditrichota bacterium]